MTTRKIGLAAVTAAMLAGTMSIAESYRCDMEADYARGWIAPEYQMTFSMSGVQMKMMGIADAHKTRTHFSGDMVQMSRERVVGVFDWNNAPVAQGGRTKVRYRAALDRRTMDIAITARIGHQGQLENAKGRCVPIN